MELGVVAENLLKEFDGLLEGLGLSRDRKYWLPMLPRCGAGRLLRIAARSVRILVSNLLDFQRKITPLINQRPVSPEL